MHRKETRKGGYRRNKRPLAHCIQLSNDTFTYEKSIPGIYRGPLTHLTYNGILSIFVIYKRTGNSPFDWWWGCASRKSGLTSEGGLWWNSCPGSHDVIQLG